jgi:hypothetical protein
VSIPTSAYKWRTFTLIDDAPFSMCFSKIENGHSVICVPRDDVNLVERALITQLPDTNNSFARSVRNDTQDPLEIFSRQLARAWREICVSQAPAIPIGRTSGDKPQRNYDKRDVIVKAHEV